MPADSTSCQSVGPDSVAPPICRQWCCSTNREVIEHFSEDGFPTLKSHKDAGSSRASASSDALGAAEGWPIHFDLELDELKSLGFLGLGPRPPHKFKTGSVYSGQWSGNQREGFGTHTWTDGAHYEGLWQSNRAQGLGRFTFPDGSVYLGQWHANHFHGLGAFYLPDGSTYRGTWVFGLCEGYGVEIRRNGSAEASTYWGRFSRGSKDGVGICRWAEGSKYIGEWRSGQVSGRGMLTSQSDGKSYRGQWLRAMKHGQGMYRWPDGRIYQGQYNLDEAVGFGSLIWPDNSRYDTLWENANHRCAGLYRDAQGSIRPLPKGLLDNKVLNAPSEWNKVSDRSSNEIEQEVLSERVSDSAQVDTTPPKSVALQERKEALSSRSSKLTTVATGLLRSAAAKAGA